MLSLITRKNVQKLLNFDQILSKKIRRCINFIKSNGKEYQVMRILKRKKGKGKQYHLPYNIEAIGKNIKNGRGKRTNTLGEKINWVGEQ